MARALWAQGLAKQAKTAALEALAFARDDPNAISLTYGLCACPVALWSGLDDEAEALTRELLEKSQRYNARHLAAVGPIVRQGAGAAARAIRQARSTGDFAAGRHAGHAR